MAVLISRIVVGIAVLSTPVLAVEGSQTTGWTKFALGIIFAAVLGTILVRELHNEPRRNDVRRHGR
jgi:hypothetical protein